MDDSFEEENFNQQEICEHFSNNTKQNVLNISIPHPFLRDKSMLNQQMNYTNIPQFQLADEPNEYEEQQLKPVNKQQNIQNKARKKYIILDDNKNQQHNIHNVHHFRLSLLSGKKNKKKNQQQLKSLSFTLSQNLSKSNNKNVKLQQSKQKKSNNDIDKHYKITKREQLNHLKINEIQLQRNLKQKNKLLTPKVKTDKLVAQKFIKQFRSIIETLQYEKKSVLNLDEVRNIIIHMRFLFSDKLNKQDMILIYELYKCLGGQINKGIKIRNLQQFLLIITGVSANQIKRQTHTNNQIYNQDEQYIIPFQCRFGIIMNKQGNIQLSEIQIQKIQNFFQLFSRNRLASRSKIKTKKDAQKQNFNYTPKINKNSKNLSETYREKVLNKKKSQIPELSKAVEVSNYLKIMENNNNSQRLQTFIVNCNNILKDTIIKEENSSKFSIINDYKSILKSDADMNLRNQQKLNFPQIIKNPLFVMQIHIGENTFEQMMIYQDERPNIETIVNKISKKYKISQYQQRILTENLKNSLKQYELSM